ncbi:MAG: hypothetical protein AB7I79_04895 [Rhizobiaceae bacterium]
MIRTLVARAVLCALFASQGIAAARAADIWTEGGAGAVAILPDPRVPRGIVGGSLYCEEQQWGLMLRVDPEQPAAVATWAIVTLGWEEHALTAEPRGGAFQLPVSPDMLEPMKAYNSMKIAIGEGAERYSATFSLAGSRRVIEAIAPRCSQIDMDGYEPVTLSDMGAATLEAEPLLADELRLFRQFTGQRPVLSAATLDLDQGDRLLFASICGSTSYFGPSGCSLSGFARGLSDPDWRQVYGTEGMHLFLDPGASNGGYPNLVTLEISGGTVPIHWVWDGESYVLIDQLIAEDEAGDATEGEEGDAAE